MITEKISKDDLILYEIIRHPALFAEFLNNIDRTEREDVFELTDYQREMACDFNQYVEFCCGRAVGKTVILTYLIIWYLINALFKGDYILYTVPNKVHLEPVWDNLVKMFRGNSLLKQFVDVRKGINSSEHSIKLNNFTSLICRIAGTSGTGANVVGLHSPFEILDEAGFYPWGTWIELQPTFNVWQDGCRMVVSGVPTGMRENNVLYYADEEDPKFNRHRIPQHRNPRYSEERELENITQYGGIDSEDYIHHVLGRHGAPVFAVFDRNLMEIKPYPVYKLVLDGISAGDVSELFTKLNVLPKIEDTFDYTVCGIDLGYTEPTAIHILYSKHGILKYHARLTWTKIPYPVQKKLFSTLDERFNKFDIIGVDSGGPGKPVVQDWMEAEEFLHRDFAKRMHPIDFSTQIVLGTNADGEELKVKMKPFAMSLAQEYSNSHRIHYSSTDMELIGELERTTYVKNPTGEVVYRTLTPRGGERGEDHHTSALLCAVVAHYIEKDLVASRPKAKKLYTPSWLVRGQENFGGYI